MVTTSAIRSSARFLSLSVLALSLGCNAPVDMDIPQQKPMVLVVEKEVPRVKVPTNKVKTLLLAQASEPVNDLEEMDRVPPKTPVPALTPPNRKRYPIDLGAALQLAGGNNLQIGLATARIREAYARLEGAEALWLPTINIGGGYNSHGGNLQDTRGEVVQVKRRSVNFGIGAKAGDAPLAGGANGPARLFIGLPLTDVLFAPLAERQRVKAARAAKDATFNETLFQVAVGYLNLVHAQGRVSIAEEAIRNAQRLLDLVKKRVKAGQDLPADRYRAEVELAAQKQARHQAEEALRVSSAELVRLLRLDPAVILQPVQAMPVPIDMVALDKPLPVLIAQGLANRPEIVEAYARVQAAQQEYQRERWRPWIPNLQVGVSGGGFAGGPQGRFGNFGDRVDFDALAVWEIQNMGFGNAARQRERASQIRQAHLNALQARDWVSAQVARSYHQIHTRKAQIEATKKQVIAAAEAIPLNFKGIFGGDLRAIEAQQAVTALSMSRLQYLTAILAYNRAQFSMLYSLGRVPMESPAHPAPKRPQTVIEPDTIHPVREPEKLQSAPTPMPKLVPQQELSSQQETPPTEVKSKRKPLFRVEPLKKVPTKIAPRYLPNLQSQAEPIYQRAPGIWRASSE